jgi:hypothetical protein
LQKHQVSEKREYYNTIQNNYILRTPKTSLFSTKKFNSKLKPHCTKCERNSDLLLGGVGTSLLAESDDGGDESAVVLHPLVGTTSRFLFLVLLRHLRCLTSHLPSTSKRSVHLTWQKKSDINQKKYIRNRGRCEKQEKIKELDRGEEGFTHGCVLYSVGDKALLGFDGEAVI